MERLVDADVLRVLALSLSGLSNKQIAQQTQLDAFAVRRAVENRRSKGTRQLIDQHPAWRAKHQHLLHKLDLGASQKSGNPVSEYEAKRLERMSANQAALAALGIEKLATGKRPRSTDIYQVRKAEAQRLLIETARKNPRRSARLQLSSVVQTSSTPSPVRSTRTSSRRQVKTLN